MKQTQGQLPIRHIIKQCQDTLQTTEREHTTLKFKYAEMQDKLHKVGKTINTLEKEERLLRRDNDDWQFELDERQNTLNYLIQLVECLDNKNHSFELDVNHNPNYKKVQHMNIKDRQVGESLIKTICHRENVNISLEALFIELEHQSTVLQDSASFWTCSRCDITMKEGENNENCIFHPGHLKYFSCRHCGADEYFTCCNMCRDCNPGCKKGLHKP